MYDDAMILTSLECKELQESEDDGFYNFAILKHLLDWFYVEDKYTTSVQANKNLALLLPVNLASNQVKSKQNETHSGHHQSILGYLQVLVFPEKQHKTQGDNLSNYAASYSSKTHTYWPFLLHEHTLNHHAKNKSWSFGCMILG